MTETCLFDVPAVAERLRVSSWTVRMLIRHKRLPVVRIGRSVRVDARDLAAYVDGLRGQRTGAEG